MGLQQPLRADAFAPGPRPPLSTDAACEWLIGARARAVILVEGWSDQAAVEALAAKRGRDLQAEGIGVVPMGGITNIDKFAQALGPPGLKLELAGLCDAAEEAHVARTLQRLALGTAHTRAEREALGFFVCDADLEDELIRALGTAGVEGVIKREGELESFRRFQDQPAQRGRPLPAHLRRFMGTRARRKIRYGSLLVGALALECVPRALDLVIDHHRK